MDFENKNISNAFKADDLYCVQEVVRAKWELLRKDINNGVYSYDDCIRAINSKFLSEFDSVFSAENGKEVFENSIDSVFEKYCVIRGARIKPCEKDLKAERFIPQKEYINDDNRFSPKGVEWLYLALGSPNNPEGKEHAVMCSKKELRVNSGDIFAICNFMLNKSDIKIVDLTVGKNWSPEKLQQDIRETISKLKSESTPETLFSEFDCIMKNHLVYAYSNLLSEALFVRLDNKDRELEYAPFHALAKYFQSYGYGGIIYQSTVYDKGRNLVLFDKTYAIPMESSICKYLIK